MSLERGFGNNETRAYDRLPEKHKVYAREVAEKMAQKFTYTRAVRQVLINHRVTHEPDVNRLMKALSRPVDELRREPEITNEQDDVEQLHEQIKAEEAKLSDDYENFYADTPGRRAFRKKFGLSKDAD